MRCGPHTISSNGRLHIDRCLLLAAQSLLVDSMQQNIKHISRNNPTPHHRDHKATHHIHQTMMRIIDERRMTTLNSMSDSAGCYRPRRLIADII